MVETPPKAYKVDSMTLAQLEIYAKELQEHFQRERTLRQELETRNRELEQRLMELTALNQLFQRYLEERSTVLDALQTLVGSLSQVSGEASNILSKVRSEKGQLLTPLEARKRTHLLDGHEDIADMG
ncbi:MAG: hypothetical protein HY681_03825 [Chloroflexi bacterium]|nr:hypothetical protein [Chloroflexota bacterium]